MKKVNEWINKQINKWERIDKSPIQKNFKSFMEILTFKPGNHNSPLLKCRLHIMTFLQRMQYGKGGLK